jgi:hypothetical protein
MLFQSESVSTVPKTTQVSAPPLVDTSEQDSLLDLQCGHTHLQVWSQLGHGFIEDFAGAKVVIIVGAEKIGLCLHNVSELLT